MTHPRLVEVLGRLACFAAAAVAVAAADVAAAAAEDDDAAMNLNLLEHDPKNLTVETTRMFFHVGDVQHLHRLEILIDLLTLLFLAAAAAVS